MAIAEYDVAPLSAVIIAGVGKVFVGTISAAGVIRVIDNPNVGRTRPLSDEVIFRAGLWSAVDTGGSGLLCFALVNIIRAADCAAVLSCKESSNLIAMAIGSVFSQSSVVLEVLEISCIAVHSIFIEKNTGVARSEGPGIVGKQVYDVGRLDNVSG